MSDEVVVEHTPNGREIRLDTEAHRFRVQPRNDNYWIEVDTIEEARDAYEHPERHR